MSLATRLFVGNLPDNVDEGDLRTAFSNYGEVTSLDIKSKPGEEANKKKFAFITLSATNYDVETCMKQFANEDFQGSRLYVTRARESFLERLQREREQAQKKDTAKNEPPISTSNKNPVIKLSEKLNPRKRKLDVSQSHEINHKTNKHEKSFEKHEKLFDKHEKSFEKHEKSFEKPHRNEYQKQKVSSGDGIDNKNLSEKDKKKLDSEKKRLESMKKKRQDFKEKQMIIKTGLVGIDKVPNKKVIFSDNEEDSAPRKQLVNHSHDNNVNHKRNTLFDDEESGDEVNFEIKKQFEGKKGQKVLDLQSRYKSDKRFVLDERFVDDDQSEDEKEKDEGVDQSERVDVGQSDEKDKQLNILQDLLGVAIKKPVTDPDSKKPKSKLGMLRFDPLQPEHAKFLAPVEETKQESSKKSKKKKLKEKQKEEEAPPAPEPVVQKVEVSKEQFYKVSETLKEAISQPKEFSLRSLFGSKEDKEEKPQEQETDYIPLEPRKEPKVKNPLNPGEKNPFVYDSSESEGEDEIESKKEETSEQKTNEVKAVWKENLFFSESDDRLQDGLAFFNKSGEIEAQKDRRELKSLMKKRIYNKERKNQMFQKKIGGRKKTMKKSYRKKS